MTLSPITLQEARSHLNFDESDGHDDDEELWGKVLAATRMVEDRTGPIRPQTVTRSCRVSGGSVELAVRPAIEIVSVLDDYGADITAQVTIQPGGKRLVGVAGIRLWGHRYTVTYLSGYDPVPEDLTEAVRLQTGLLWSTQRGPSTSSRFTAIGGDGISSPGGLDAMRLAQILDGYDPPMHA
jgi:hypothetical protein